VGRLGESWLGGVVALLLSGVSIACDRTSASSPSICDGTATLRLRVFVADQPGRELRGSVVRTENGVPSLAVDGACNYWVAPGWTPDTENPDLGWRKGHLDVAQQKALDAVLPFDDLATLEDCGDGSAIFDASDMVIAGPSSRASCVVSGPRFHAAWSTVWNLSAELWNRASPMDGGMRVSAVLANSGDTSKVYPWPLGEPILGFLLSTDAQFSPGEGLAVTEPLGVGSLRALRAQYVSDRKATPGLFFDGQKMSDGTTTALVYMQDMLPYADDRGLLPFAAPR
jgi:hypothetical protein